MANRQGKRSPLVVIGLIAVYFTFSSASGAEITSTSLTVMSEGAPVQAILYKPREVTGKLPAVVLSPGGGRDITGLEWLSRALAERGYVVLAQRYRDGRVRFHLRDVEDTRHAIAYLQGLPYVDAARVGLVGHSAGGAASLIAAAKDPRVRSTVALSPQINRVRWVRGLREHAPGSYAQQVKVHGGTPEDSLEYYQESSALSYASDIKTPVILIHGLADLDTPAEHSRSMYDALVKAGNPQVKLELLPRLAHFYEEGFQGYRFDKVVDLVARWLSETLK